MPELPEVERARKLIQDVAAGKCIQYVETVEDALVFSEITHDEFCKEVTGRRIKAAHRYGKHFYLELDGGGRMPVLHFGMTGLIQVKGQEPTFYKKAPKLAHSSWPPRFYKFILHLADDSDGEVIQLAFADARRLGRIRLRLQPLAEPPLSELGFDPILSMPTEVEFTSLVLKRSCPVKALLLDQSFSAGVGNWVADEILYNSRIHPEQKCNTLSPEQLVTLHRQTAEICRIAVSVNADDSKFPEHWLFRHRWDKGKNKKSTLKQPSGEAATIKWITVGGRTSAYVVELQVRTTPSISGSRKARKRRQDDQENENEESDLTSLSDLEAAQDCEWKSSKKRAVSRKRARR